MKKIFVILILNLFWCNTGIAETFNEEKDKLPITPGSIGEWDYTCKKEDFIKYVATIEGCIALKKLGKIDKSKKKLVIFLHGDRKDKSDYKILEQGNFTKAIKDQKDNINFFYLARPGHKFTGRSRSVGKYKAHEQLNDIIQTVVFKKGWEMGRLISQALYRLKEFYKPDELIVIGFSGGSVNMSVIAGKVPGLVDKGILGGCDCKTNRQQFWTSIEFIKYIPPETELILITGKDDPYINWNISYVKEAKKLGKNVEHHIVTGEHSVNSTLLRNEGFEILKEALK